MSKHERRMTFENTGETFSGLDEATYWLAARGFIVGSLQRGAPCGVCHESRATGVSKWRNMSKEEHEALDGRLVADLGSFRDSDVHLSMKQGPWDRWGAP